MLFTCTAKCSVIVTMECDGIVIFVLCSLGLLEDLIIPLPIAVLVNVSVLLFDGVTSRRQIINNIFKTEITSKCIKCIKIFGQMTIMESHPH